MASVAVAQQTAPAPSLWQNRTFVSLAAAHIISVIGDGFHTVALGLWVLQTTGSSTAMGVVMTVRVLTTVLLGALAGTVVDRSDRRRIMIATDLIRVLLVGALALLVGTSGTLFALVLALTGLTSVAGQFFNPAFQASLVHVVGKEELSRASSLLQIGTTLSHVAGPFLAGMVVGFFGGKTALLIDAATFLVSALLIMLAAHFPSPRRERQQQSNFWQDLREGLAYIRQQPVVRNVTMIGPIINFFGNALGGVLLPVLAVKVWMASSAQFGALEGVFPLGFAIGAGLLMAFSSRLKRRGLLIFGSLIVASALFTLVPLMPGVVAAMPVAFLSGIFMAVPNVLLQVLVQSEADPDKQGRVFGVMGSLMSMTAPVAFLLAGRLADMFPPVTVAVTAGVLLVASVLFSFVAAPALRRYQ